MTPAAAPGRRPHGLRAATLITSALFAAPALYLVVRSLTDDADPKSLLVSDRTSGPLWRTIQLAVLVSVSAAVIGTATAWLVTRTDLPFRRTLRVLLPLPLVYPTFIGAAALVRTLNPGGLVNDALSSVGVDRTPQLTGLAGSWLVLTLFTYPYVYFPVAARLSTLPSSIEQTSLLLGSSLVSTFRRIVLPQIARSLTAGMLLVFLYAISDFGAVAILRYDTLTRAIEANQLANRPVALALSLILLVLAGLVVVSERAAHRGHLEATTDSVQSITPIALGRWRWPSLAAVAFLLLNAIGAPFAALLDWSIRGFDRAQRGGRGLTIDAGEVASVTTNTLVVSAITAAVAVLAVLPIALLVGRYRSFIGQAGYTVAIATFALPGILVALSVKFWTLQWDWAFDTFNNTHAALIFAYVVRFAALAMGTTLVAVTAVPERLRDAASTLGAGGWRRTRSVELPIMLPGLLAAAGLVLLSTMKELPISLIVAPIGFQTLTTKTFGSFTESFVAEAGVMALTLVALSFVATWFLIIRNQSMEQSSVSGR